jgi:predicted membrane protein
MNNDERDRARSGASLLTGLFIMAVGVLFLLGNLGLVETRSIHRFWPLILILIGVQKLLQRDDRRGHGGAYFWIGIGSWFLLTSVFHLHFWSIWPLVLIAVGGRMLWRSLYPNRATVGADASSTLRGTAFMGSLERSLNTRDFRGGDVTVVMGGCKADLGEAGIASGEAVLDVFVLWGGLELLVPEGWTVISQVVPILGGFDDRTRPPAEATQRLVISGLVMIGGVQVKNAPLAPR